MPDRYCLGFYFWWGWDKISKRWGRSNRLEGAHSPKWSNSADHNWPLNSNLMHSHALTFVSARESIIAMCHVKAPATPGPFTLELHSPMHHWSGCHSFLSSWLVSTDWHNDGQQTDQWAWEVLSGTYLNAGLNSALKITNLGTYQCLAPATPIEHWTHAIMDHFWGRFIQTTDLYGTRCPKGGERFIIHSNV